MIELKPCPFCGSTDIRNRGAYCACQNCGTSGPDLRDDGSAEYKWDSRVIETEDTPEVPMPWRLQIAAQLVTSLSITESLECADTLIAHHERTKK